MYKLFPSILCFFLLCFCFSACKKSPPVFCWQQVDAYGNDLQIICNKTEAEIQALYPNPCNYYKAGGEKFCWLRNGVLIKDASQEKIDNTSRCFGTSATITKVDCGYCVTWYHRIKTIYKPASAITYSPVKSEQFCGDTAKTIYQGRQVVLKETTDSLIVRQFSNNGTNW